MASTEKLVALHAHLSAIVTYTGTEFSITSKKEDAKLYLSEFELNIKTEAESTVDYYIQHIIQPFIKNIPIELVQRNVSPSLEEIIRTSAEKLFPDLEEREKESIITKAKSNLIPSEESVTSPLRSPGSITPFSGQFGGLPSPPRDMKGKIVRRPSEFELTT